MGKMKVIYNWSSVLFLIIGLGALTSCNNDDVEFVDPRFKTLEISSGGNFEIPVLTAEWTIESVKDAVTGQVVSDEDGEPLALGGIGKVVASNGWLELSRDSNEAFVINLKENFNKTDERKLTICINNSGKRDYVTVVQRAGQYELVKSKYEEIEEQRSIYVSDEDCTSIILTNHLSTEVWEPTGVIYKDVVETSIFESDSYGAFDWMPEEGIDIAVPDLIIDSTIRGKSNLHIYKEGVTTIPYIKDIANGNTILMKPFSTLYLSGEITYCKRVCDFTFTIQNMGSGTRFDIEGTWTQIVPISSHTISSDT